MMIWKKPLLVLLLVIVPILSAKAQEILKAAADGEMDKLKGMIEADTEQMGATDGAGRAAIHFAANGGHTEIVKFLVAKGVDKDLRTRADTTPLHYAALNGHIEIVRLLISEGANLEIKNTQTATPLYFAAMKGHTEVLKYLIEKGAVVDALDREEGTPLHAAAQSGHLESVRLLIEKGADKNKIDTNGRSAMHFACQNGNREIIALLKDNGLTWGDPDLFGKTPLYYAAERGHKDAVTFIISEGLWGVHDSGSDENTYLHAAATGGLIDFAELLLSGEADANAINIYRITPLDRAVKNNNTEVAELLITRNAVKSDEANPFLKGAYLGQSIPGMTPEIFAPGIISTEDFNERDVSFSRDGTEFYFSRWGGQTPFNIMYMKREHDQWSEQRQASFSGRYQDAEAYFSPDEQKLFFISNRPKHGDGDPETWEIWFVEREGNEWGAPVLLGSPFEGDFIQHLPGTGRCTIHKMAIYTVRCIPTESSGSRRD